MLQSQRLSELTSLELNGCEKTKPARRLTALEMSGSRLCRLLSCHPGPFTAPGNLWVQTEAATPCLESEQLYISEKKVHQITVEESVVVVKVMRYIQANDDLPEEISRQLH